MGIYCTTIVPTDRGQDYETPGAQGKCQRVPSASASGTASVGRNRILAPSTTLSVKTRHCREILRGIAGNTFTGRRHKVAISVTGSQFQR